MGHTHSGILFSRKKEGNPAIGDSMDLEGTMLNEVSQREILHGIPYMWNQTNKIHTLRNREEKSGYRGLGGKGNRERLVKGHKLLAVKYVMPEILCKTW